ncbi:YcxB family protein [Actinoplanes hulinensis]|uniref:YcxB family protein n=1 Tax=Actinoplanes hulinensis TaxID=1144547 RepID=A0ABS7B4M2_9ACTN|nr:YcxB family protein [Actinoplanes hulinensis]MBW6435991.1 YcxB family protein [Actinoplanes hulinensis]
MQIEFTHARSPEYYRNRFPDRTSRTAKILAALVYPIGIVAVFIVVGGEFSPNALVTGGLLILSAIAAIGCARWLAVRAARRTAPAPEAELVPHDWVLTDERLVASTAESSTEYEWSAFEAMWVLDDAYLLRTATGRTVDIPRAPLTTEQDAELRTFLCAVVDRPESSIGPDRPESSIGPDRPESSIGPDRPESSIGPDRPDSAIGSSADSPAA